jgi:hypothetical protein
MGATYSIGDAPDIGPQLTPQAIAVLGGAGQLATPINVFSGIVNSTVQNFATTWMAVGDKITNTLDRIESNPSGNALLNLGVAALALRMGNAEPLEEEVESLGAVGEQLEFDFAKNLSERTTYLYDKLSAAGEHLKYGVSYDPLTRYTSGELAGGRLNILASGPREQILQLERNLHETLPLGLEERQSFYIDIQVRKGLLPPWQYRH